MFVLLCFTNSFTKVCVSSVTEFISDLPFILILDSPSQSFPTPLLRLLLLYIHSCHVLLLFWLFLCRRRERLRITLNPLHYQSTRINLPLLLFLLRWQRQMHFQRSAALLRVFLNASERISPTLHISTQAPQIRLQSRCRNLWIVGVGPCQQRRG